MSKAKTAITTERAPIITVRFVIALLLFVAGIAWVTWYYTSVRPDPGVFPPVDGSPRAIADLGRWNYTIGFGLAMLGLMVSAHPSTPLGRGRGVVIAMLSCFLLGLVWIILYYIFANDLSGVPVFNDLGNWNLAVGIALMGVGFSFATKWE